MRRAGHAVLRLGLAAPFVLFSLLPLAWGLRA